MAEFTALYGVHHSWAGTKLSPNRNCKKPEPEAFAAEVTQTRKRLASVEQAIVAQGNELREAVGRLVERIDAVAPAPTQPAAAAP